VPIHPRTALSAVLDAVSGNELDLNEKIIINIRIPRVLMCAIVGSALSTAGVVMQAIFRNPMAEPYVLGISSGAGLGAIIGFIFSFNMYAVSASAFLTSLLVVFLVYSLARIRGVVTTESLLLAGIAVNFFLYALEWLMLIKTRAYLITTWLIGCFGGVDWLSIKISFLPVLLGVLLSLSFSKELNAILLGEESAHYIGVEVKRVRNFLLIISTLITAVSVSFVGLIGFVGLMIPHISRILVGDDHRILIPVSMMIGSIFLIWMDTLSRTVLGNIPVGIITMLCGGPFFLYLLRRRSVLL